jgi:ribosomal protein L7Ae-like RNA K-turn-binding protein
MNKSASKIILLFVALTSIFSSFYSNAEQEKFKLITMLYNETNEERITEYLTCLEKNLAHDRIDQIHVVYDISKDDNKKILLNYLKNKNVPITYVSSRATYAFCFNLANELFPDSRIILSNADIYFNETLELLDDYDLTDKFLILTRWDIGQDGSLSLHAYSPKSEKSYSHDSWFFSTPLHFEDGNVLIGTPGCDGTIAFQAQKNALGLLNPCFSIQGCHLHLSGLRHYEQKTAYPYISLLPVPYDRITDPPHKNLLTASELIQKNKNRNRKNTEKPQKAGDLK